MSHFPERILKTEREKNSVRKALDIIKNVLVWLVVAVAVLMAIFTFASKVFGDGNASLFGYRAYIVRSDSMSATHFNAGDLIFSKEVDGASLQEGDVITFISSGTESFGEIVTHKIRTKTTDANGNPGFITYGTTTGTDDESVVTYEYIQGKYTGNIPGAGYFFDFLKTPQGYAVLILTPFLILIIYQGINCINLFRRYKKEQTAELEAEKAQISAEREETAKMLAELQALKAQMEGTAPPSQPEGEKTE